jgi:hypothetical protein
VPQLGHVAKTFTPIGLVTLLYARLQQPLPRGIGRLAAHEAVLLEQLSSTRKKGGRARLEVC